MAIKQFVSFFKGDLIRASTIIFLASFFGSIIAFLANLYLASALGPKDFGVYKTIGYFFTFLPFLVGFGMQSTLPKYVAEFKVKNKRKIGHLVNWFIKTRSISFLISILMIFLLRDKISLYILHDISLNYLIIPGIVLFVAYFFEVFLWIVLGYQNFKLFSLSYFLYFSLSAIFSVALVPFGLFYVLLGWALGIIFACFLTLPYLLSQRAFSNKLHYNMHDIIWKFSMPMYGLRVIMSLASVAVPFFSLFFSRMLIGYYSYALIFYTASLLIPNAVSLVVLPKVSELIGLKKVKAAKNMLIKTLKIYSPFVLVGIIVTLLVSEFFILKISPEYLPSLTMFKSLIIFGLFSGYLFIFSFYLQGRGLIKETALIILFQVFLLFLISFILLKSLA